MPFACLFAPFFIVEAVMRTEEGGVRIKSNAPVAVLDGPESMLRIIACNQHAAELGACTGMTRTQAEQKSSLILQKRSVECEQRAQAALLECGLHFSPRVESTAAGAVTLDVAGLGKLFGPPKKVATAIRKRARAMGFEVNVAIAGNPDTALLRKKNFFRLCRWMSFRPRRNSLQFLIRGAFALVERWPSCRQWN